MPFTFDFFYFLSSCFFKKENTTCVSTFFPFRCRESRDQERVCVCIQTRAAPFRRKQNEQQSSKNKRVPQSQ